MTIAVSRRGVLLGAAGVGVAAAAPMAASPTNWDAVRRLYDLPDGVVQLENGNWGAMARPVRDAYRGFVERVNRDTSFYARRGMARDLLAVRADVAAELDVDPEEIAFTRNATEALSTLILQYAHLAPGDAVLCADHDYDSMQACMASLARRHGARLVQIVIPQAALPDVLVETYRAAFDARPRPKLVLLTHLSHRSGLVLPVRAIAALARERGIDVVLDTAHSWQQLDFTLRDLSCDLVGLNGHKWLGAPLGVGIVRIARGALDRIERHPAAADDEPDAVGARIHTGTHDFAAALTVPAALTFQRSLGRGRRCARLAALRNRWVARARATGGIEILTPDDPTSHGGITAFRLAGMTDVAGNQALARRLLEQHGVFTVVRTGLAGGACIRVTPALHTREADVDALASALAHEVAHPRS